MAVDPHIRTLFDKYLDGSLTKEEYQELLRYADESDDIEFREMFQDAFADGTNVFPVTRSTLDEVSDTVAARLREKIEARSRFYIPRWLQVVAACLLTLIAVAAFFISKQEQTTLISAYGDDVAPGTYKATISLSDGASFELEGNKNGIITNENGRLSYEDGTVIDPGSEISIATMQTPNSAQYRLTLPDGTKVSLNAATKIEYPTQFTGTERIVKLQGEAYFEVAHDTQRPFIVESEKQRIMVLGTKFNVQAYPEEHTETTLAEGSVRIKGTDDKIDPVVLRPDQQATLTDKAFELTDVRASDYTAWTRNEFIFEGITLSRILAQLERWYDVEFSYPPHLGTEQFYAEISRDQKLSQVLKLLGRSNGLKFEIKGRRITIRQ